MICVTVARKPFEGGTLEGIVKHGAGGLNIGACRIGSAGGTRRGGVATKPTVAGWANMGGHIVVELDVGRWPSNLILHRDVVDGLALAAGLNVLQFFKVLNG